MASRNSFDAATSTPLSVAAIQVLRAQGVDGAPADPLGGSSRLAQLLTQMEKLLAERYAFDVFAKDSINFGIMITYRQEWKPEQYQVGDLVSTIPLAPKEVRRYTTRSVTKKSRAQRELEDNVQTRRTESSDANRADSQIVKKAQEKTDFNLSAKETFGDEGMSISSTQSAGGSSTKDSEQTKREMRESVLKSAQEYREQHRMEVDASESTETESTTYHEIQNPNDELAVTYLFYELQRTYLISESIYKLTPVILVANEVPAPQEIDDAWLIQHDWILRRAILDDSFRPAIDYLTKSFVGAEISIRILESNAIAQKTLVDKISQQIQTQMGLLASNERSVQDAVEGLAGTEQQQGIFNTVKRIFDPIGITGGADSGAVDAAQAMVDYARQTLDRSERERARLLGQLDIATTALQAAVNKLSSAVKEHYDHVAEIDRLRVHVKDNILYYMQAIWRQEPPDQRFFRLYNIDVPIVTPVTNGVTANVVNSTGREMPVGLSAVLGRDDIVLTPLPMPPVEVIRKKLVDVADLDNLLAYKGNYMVFALKENNYITWHMMQDYLDVGDVIRLRDPDPLSNYTIEQLQELATTVLARTTDEAEKRARREEFKQMLIDRLIASRKANDRVIVPTNSLYIECLVGTHPLLEDFKMIHRALDVKKVQAEVRHAELENIRLAARALEGEREDPDIEKKVVIEGPAAVTVND